MERCRRFSTANSFQQCFALALVSGLLYCCAFMAYPQGPLATAPSPRPELVLQLGHSDEVERTAFSPDDRILASGDNAGVVKLWDTETGDLLASWPANDQTLSLAFSPDGRWLAAGGTRNTKVWDWRTRTLARTFEVEFIRGKQYPERVVNLAWSPDGKTLVTIDGSARLWDVATGQQQREVKTRDFVSVNVVAFSSDGQLMATSGDGVRVWEANTGKLVRVISWEGASAIAFLPDGHTLVTGNGPWVRLWDIRNGKLLRLPSPVRGISGGALSEDGRLLARATQDRHIQLWDVQTGHLLHTIATEEPAFGSRFPPRDEMMLSHQGRLISQLPSSQYGTIVLSDTETGRRKLVFQGMPGGTSPLAYAPDGHALVTGYSGSRNLMLWDTRTGHPVRTLPVRGYVLARVAFAPDGFTLYGIPRLEYGVQPLESWDITTGQRRAVPELEQEFRAIALSPDGKLVAGADGSKIELLDLRSRKTLHTLTGFGGLMPSLTFAPDGRLLASTDNSAIRLWDVATGHRMQTLTTGNPYGASVYMAFSPDSTLVASRDHDSGTIDIWDTRTGQHLRGLAGHGPTHGAFIFSPDSKTIAVGGHEAEIDLWNVATGQKERTITTQSGGRPRMAMAFAPDGQVLATEAQDGAAQFWNVADGSLRATLMTFPAPRPARTAKAPNPAIAHTASQTGPGSGAGFGSASPLPDWIAYTPAGYYDSSPGAARFIRWRDGEKLWPAERYEATFHRPDLVQKALAGG